MKSILDVPTFKFLAVPEWSGHASGFPKGHRYFVVAPDIAVAKDVVREVWGSAKHSVRRFDLSPSQTPEHELEISTPLYERILARHGYSGFGESTMQRPSSHRVNGSARLKRSDVNVEVIRPSGMLLVTAIVDGEYFKRRYDGFTKDEAIRMFIVDVTEEIKRDGFRDGSSGPTSYHRVNGPAKLRRDVGDYASARSAVGRLGRSGALAHNTRLVEDGEDVAVVLHNTRIVTFHADGSVTLNSGGYHTSTTKARINSLIGPRLSVKQVAHDWFVIDARDGSKVPFKDGMRVNVR